MINSNYAVSMLVINQDISSLSGMHLSGFDTITVRNCTGKCLSFVPNTAYV